MIDTVARLLDEIAARETESMDALGITHRPTIGGMYEGLTADVLSKALPIDQPLSVVSGFIRKEDGSLSRELDCIVVLGQVEDIPHSQKKICSDLAAVVAVIQVKKGLYGKDIADGHENLRDVRYIKPETEYATESQLSQAFELIARTPLVGHVDSLPPLLRHLFHLLRVHLNTPCCILLGYHGYVSHQSFRAGVAGHLKSLVGKLGYGPMSLPDVILNQRVAAVKNIALPWNGPLWDDMWPFYMTARTASPHKVLLEAIWTRLVFRKLLSGNVFGEDLDVETWTVLAAYKFDEVHNGWMLATYEDRAVEEEALPSGKWNPPVLTKPQFVLVNALCRTGSERIPDLAEVGLTEEDITFLRDQGLVARDSQDPCVYRMITQECRCCILPDGRFVAADDISGRLARWVTAFIVQRKAERSASDASSGNHDVDGGVS